MAKTSLCVPHDSRFSHTYDTGTWLSPSRVIIPLYGIWLIDRDDLRQIRVRVGWRMANAAPNSGVLAAMLGSLMNGSTFLVASCTIQEPTPTSSMHCITSPPDQAGRNISLGVHLEHRISEDLRIEMEDTSHIGIQRFPPSSTSHRYPESPGGS